MGLARLLERVKENEPEEDDQLRSRNDIEYSVSHSYGLRLLAIIIYPTMSTPPVLPGTNIEYHPPPV